MAVTEFTRVVTQKGQVTIPAQVRRLLGIKPNGRVVFSVREGQVTVTAVRETIDSVCGVIASLTKPMSWEEMRNTVREERAAHIIAEINTHDAVS